MIGFTQEHPYRITGYVPVQGGGLHSHSFGIEVHWQFAQAAASIKQEDFQEQAAERAVKRLEIIWPDMEYYRPPLRFYQDSILVTNIQVPGNACGLDASVEDVQELLKPDANKRRAEAMRWPHALRYSPHNLDGMRQAYGLLSLWLSWFNVAAAYVAAEDRYLKSEPASE